MKSLLSPLGKIYGRLMTARNARYDRESFRTISLGARTISVGNITTGGTGKTPIVKLIAEILAADGENVCILTRGYGRANASERVLVSDGMTALVDAKTGGDEPVELATSLAEKGVVIVADRDRVAAAKWARERYGTTVFVLDDGFQHRRAKRDLDLVCIDATDPFGGGQVLPAGNLREPISGLKRANAFVTTRADQADTSPVETLLREYNPNAPILYAETRVVKLVEIDGTEAKQRPPSPLEHQFVFAGIGNPQSFIASLNKIGIKPVGELFFTDHFSYEPSSIERIERMAIEKGADSLITTAKDAVKLQHAEFRLPCFVALAETVIDDPEAFRSLVLDRQR
jgi:tetraacyldisaccharide 4'-kinase